jgi:hypothetical protein
MQWFYPMVNLLFCAACTWWDFKNRRVMAMFWLLATYFSLLVTVDLGNCPLEYPIGYVSATASAEEVSKAAAFMFWCNLFFALGENVVFGLMERKPLTVFFLFRNDYSVRFQTRVALAMFAVGCLLYIPQIYRFSYADYVTDTTSSWKALIFLSSMPLISLLLLQRRYRLAMLPLAVNLLLVFLIKVRSFMLFSIIPALVIIVFQWAAGRQPAMGFRRWGRYVAVASMVVLLGGVGSYISYQRTNEWRLPESLLPQGMYLIFQQIDSGMPKTGFQSVQLAVTSLLYPVYNKFLMADYQPPEDPAVYMAELVTGRSGWKEGFRHFPLLWYSDVYAALGWTGVFLGLLWGGVLALWEAAMRKNTLAWAMFLPFFVWTLYILCRGAPGHAFYVISRNLYIQLFLLFITGLHYGRVERKRRAAYLMSRKTRQRVVPVLREDASISTG